MDRQAATPGNKPGDRLARQRVAAVGKTYHNVVDTTNDNGTLGLSPAELFEHLAKSAYLTGLGFLFRFRQRVRSHLAGGQFTVTDGCKQVVPGFETEFRHT